MNRKQLLLLLVLVVVLGGAGLLLFRQQTASWKGGGTAAGRKLLPDLPVNDITRVLIKQGTNELNLVKKDDFWRVRERADYPANYSLVSEFLLKARDLKIVQSEQVGASQLGRLELLPPGPATNTATLVEFRDKSDKVVKALLLGKKQMKSSPQSSPMGEFGEAGGGWAVGRFVMLAGTSGSVAVISDPLESMAPKPDQWINKDFFKVEKAKSVAVTFAEPTNSWSLTRDTESADWKLADAKAEEKLDNSKASTATSGLGYPSFADVLPADTAPANVGLDKPTIATIQTLDGFTYSVKIGAKTNDNYHMTLAVSADFPKGRTPGKDEKPEDKTKLDKEFKDKTTKLSEKLEQEKKLEGWVYRVSSWTLDSLLKHRAELFVEKKEEAKKDDKPAEETTKDDDATKEEKSADETPTNAPPKQP
jgi:hypothetical protein